MKSREKEKDPDPIEIPSDVLSQLAYWVQQRTILLMMFHRGLHTMAAICRATDLSEGRFMLIDETTLAIHLIRLEKCLKIELRKSEKIKLDKEREVGSVFLQDAEQTVEIGHFTRTAEDALARFTSSSDLID